MLYRFNKTIGYDDQSGIRRKAQAGDEVDASAILPGCLESCLRCGHVEPIESATKAQIVAQTDEPAESPAKVEAKPVKPVKPNAVTAK